MSFSWNANGDVEREEFALDALSQQLNVSQQTLVRWSGRHLIDAELGWTLDEENNEVRVIRLREGKLQEIQAFAAEYRQGYVTRQEARRILKMIDRKRIKKMVRAGDIETAEVDDETKVLVGSIEDYLIEHEHASGS